MTHFWAKTTFEGKPGISVYEHMTNVGCVAQCLAKIAPELLHRFCLKAPVICALSALHDLGKISPGFQRKCEEWLKLNGLCAIERNGVWDTSMEKDHGKVTHAAVQDFLLNKMGLDRKTSKFVSAALGAHHGYLNPPNDRGYMPGLAISEDQSGIGWHTERIGQAQKVWDQFNRENDPFFITDDSPALWWLAGLTSVADWIGSDERFFPADSTNKSCDRKQTALKALDTIGFERINIIQGLTFHDLFHDTTQSDSIWMPNDMQKKTFSLINSPGVYVIEAPMGMGKTEAALWASYKLLAAGDARGIYFALPTQATSNRMHLRFNDFLGRICPQNSVSRLIHGNSWLMGDHAGIQPSTTTIEGLASEDARAGRDWFASPKRAMLASFGVGTVDQALLGIVAAKHFFVRHFALAGKIVILDEIHSYDIYTGTLIDKLISTLESLGCTVIVLSATLTGKRRRQIVSCQKEDTNDDEQPYPLLTGCTGDQSLPPLLPDPPEPKTVAVEFISHEDATRKAIALARNGGAVLWICNTVDAAQCQYQQFKEQIKDEFPIGLLHSRFPFWRREQLETEWMERFGKSGKTRCASILIATQVVEQSVDLDADLLITELAPTDMLLQRLGRLWRHERACRPVDSARICILDEDKSLEDFQTMEDDEICKTLGNKALVYDPYVLLRSFEVWSTQNEIIIPDQIREFLEFTYMDKLEEPEAWTTLYDEMYAKSLAYRQKALMSSNIWNVQLSDEEGVQTRINEVPTITLPLYRSFEGNDVRFIDDSIGRIDHNQYIFATAQAIHRNIVKIPEYCVENIEQSTIFSDYVYGKQTAGIITEDGTVEISGTLKDGIRFFYSNTLGLVIDKAG